MPEDNSDSRRFIAYEINPEWAGGLQPAPVRRKWMDQTASRFAYRCLPLAMANQTGWIIRCSSSFSVRWNGGPTVDDLFIVHDALPPNPLLGSVFGHGIITFNIPYLFRTPKDVNLWVKGPSNQPRDGVSPLEGIVETDWSSASFTMNWKITRPNHLIRFECGEPICMVVPFPREYLESLEPELRDLKSDPETYEAYMAFQQSRDKFHELKKKGDPQARKAGWQKDYF